MGSTTGLNLAAAAAAAAATSSTTTTTTTSIVSDDEDAIGTENTAHFNSQLVEDDELDITLPDINTCNFPSNPDESDQEIDIDQNNDSMQVDIEPATEQNTVYTHFRPLTAKEKRKKPKPYKHCHIKIDSSLDSESE